MKWTLQSSGCFTGEHMQTNMVVPYRLVQRVMAGTPKRSLMEFTPYFVVSDDAACLPGALTTLSSS